MFKHWRNERLFFITIIVGVSHSSRLVPVSRLILHAELTRTWLPMSPEAKAWGTDSAGRKSVVSSRFVLARWLAGWNFLLCTLNLEIIVLYLHCLCCK